MSLKHRKVSAVADGPNTALVRPSDWGSTSTDYGTAPTHVFDGGALGALAMRDTGTPEGFSWLPSAAGVLVSAGTAQAPAFRPLLAADIPALAYEPVFGTLGVAKGGTGTATAFTLGSVLFAGASGIYSQRNLNFFWDDTNRQLRVGDVASSGLLFNSQGQFVARKEGGSNPTIRIESAGGGVPFLAFDVINGTFASPSAITSAQNMGSIVGTGFDGGIALQHGPQITMTATENWTTTAHGSAMIFYSVAAGTTTQLNTLEVSQGNVGIGQAGPAWKLTLHDGRTGLTTSQTRVLDVTNTSMTFDTTAGALRSVGAYFNNTSTRATGANALTNVGLIATASGAQFNYAAEFDGFVGIQNSAPVVELDVIGNGWFGNTAANRASNSGYPLGVLHSGANQLIMIRSGVVQARFQLNSSPLRLDVVDNDHSSVVPLSIALDGSKAIKTFAVTHVAGTFAALPSSPVEGMTAAVTDSSTATWGATITGGGANHVLAYYNGTNWTVAGK